MSTDWATQVKGIGKLMADDIAALIDHIGLDEPDLGRLDLPRFGPEGDPRGD